MIKLKSINFAKMNAAEQLNFHQTTIKEAAAVKEASMEGFVGAYKENVEKLAEQMFSETEKLTPVYKADRERDSTYVHAKACARAMMGHFDKEVAEAAAVVYHVFKSNTDANKASLNEESTIFHKVIHDLGLIPAEVMEKACFTGWPQELLAKQTAYEDIVKAQNVAIVEKSKGMSLKELRNKCQEHYRNLAHLVTALSFAGPSPELESFISHMNLHIQKQTEISAQRAQKENPDAPLPIDDDDHDLT